MPLYVRLCTNMNCDEMKIEFRVRLLFALKGGNAVTPLRRYADALGRHGNFTAVETCGSISAQSQVTARGRATVLRQPPCRPAPPPWAAFPRRAAMSTSIVACVEIWLTCYQARCVYAHVRTCAHVCTNVGVRIVSASKNLPSRAAEFHVWHVATLWRPRCRAV